MEKVEDQVLAKEQIYIYSITRRWEKRGQYTIQLKLFSAQLRGRAIILSQG